MSILDGVGIQFKESLSGYVRLGESDPGRGAEVDESLRAAIRFDVRISITDLDQFLKISQHDARLEGTVTCQRLGGSFPIRDGRFNLFTLHPATGRRQLEYAFKFTAADGQTYYLYGHKEIYHDPGCCNLVKEIAQDMTKLFTTVYRGQDNQAPVYGAGLLYFKLLDAPSLAKSMKITGATTWKQKAAAYMAFISYAFGVLQNEYLKGALLFYDTEYENLVLSGLVQTEAGPSRPFFFVSGAHGKGFPWGDGETFWDAMLAVDSGNGGYECYCISDRVLEGLDIDVEQGRYRYRGPLFSLNDGYAASFSQMRGGAPHLMRCEAEIEIDFKAQPYEETCLPFPVLRKYARRFTAPLMRPLEAAFRCIRPLGVRIIPHTVAVSSGMISIQRPGPDDGSVPPPLKMQVDTGLTFGEAESSTFRNIKAPTLLYNYICAVQPASQAARVQIRSGTLRGQRQKWIRDRISALLGAIVPRVASVEILMRNGTMRVRRLRRPREEADSGSTFVKLGTPILEVNNDHFPTAVFQRRIVKVRDPSGHQCLALEEDMTLMRLEARNSRKRVVVASIRDDDKFAALDRVLEETGFDDLVQERLAASGKDCGEFCVVIKPNFMFAYNKLDATTYTDPQLVGHLVERLRAAGLEKIAVVEAQSAYGEYFDKRRVCEVAQYLGFDQDAGYDVIDMTEDASESEDLGPHLGFHPVSSAWRDADLRISFAKNKTHAYAYYTLTLKNIYGALPLAAKFKEYHCDRDIYHTTIEYLTRFHVDYGLVDAHLSSDGLFGVFADTRPAYTRTIIGGSDLVAVDWVAATKMGIDPMISKYMHLAVDRFGKPEIKLVGDGSQYRPWVNVPTVLSLITNRFIDAHYHFSNLLYSVGANLDETHFQHKNKALYIRFLRRLTLPFRRMVFRRTLEEPSLGNRIFNWLQSLFG
jgi:uncharacterized protein (DUF362 family)